MEQKNKYAFSLFVIGSLFFIFGFITWVNSILMPFLQITCELTEFQSAFVPFAFYISYFVMSIPASFLIKKVGYSNGMMIGLLTMAVGSILFVPAAITRSYLFFLVGLFVQGIGLSVLQTASNPYATILGPIETAARRVSLMGICNKLAGIIGVYVLYNALFSGMDKEMELLKTQPAGPARNTLLQSMSEQIILPYIIITIVFLLLVIFLKLAKLPKIESAENQQSGTHKSIFAYPYMWLGVVAIFFYVGAEVIAIDYLPKLGVFWGYPLAFSKSFSAFALIAMLLGYIVGIATIPKMISQRQALIVNVCLAAALVCVALFTKGMLSIACIIMLSFAHAIMWPAIWPLSIHDLGRHTELASGLLVMAIAGGAVMPLIYSRLCENFGNQYAYILLFVSYAYILFFAAYGYKIKTKESQ